MPWEGTILRGPDLEPVQGRLVLEDDAIAAIEEATVSTADIIVPAFVNAHVHLGDSIAKGAGAGLSLEELVAPPDGLKHRLLAAAGAEELAAAMARTLGFMASCGTSACVDFREGGVAGVEALRAAAADSDVDVLAYGRGSTDVLEVADGFGASGANDADFSAERRAAREAGLPFAIHAGEADASDLEGALDLEPDLLVHVVHPERTHLEWIEAAEIPVVVCPRSNLTTGVGLPPVATLREHTTVALGTDNVMLASPSPFREMETLARLTDLSDRAILQMATVDAAAAVGRDDGVLAPGRPARFLVIDGDSDNLAGLRDPVRGVVRRAGPADVRTVVLR